MLVELFTSQGCSSCPPADALLGELAGDPDVLPLAFHVTYWDGLGWTDGFADMRFDERQRTYAKVLGVSSIYTPQMVVGGELDVVGSSRSRVLAAIGVARTHGGARPLHVAANGRVAVPADLERVGTELWAAAWDGPRTVTIERGENAGRTLTYHNVVRWLQRWVDVPMQLVLPVDELGRIGLAGVAVVAQRRADGRVLAVGRLAL